MKHKIISSFLMLFIIAGIVHPTPAAVKTDGPVYAITPETSKLSSQAIHISWDSSYDSFFKYYYVMRRGTKNSKGTGQWKTVAKINSDGIDGGPLNSYTDQLLSSSPQQYEYKICTLSKDKKINTRNAEYKSQTDRYAVLGSNIKICIDPGHFGNLNNNYGLDGKNGNFPYSEAEFNMDAGIALHKELKQSYGIDSFLTRSGSSITLKYGGKKYSNENLDEKNISVRGKVAKTEGCDFFISLHTNSTSREKNAWSQPKSINKVFVFVNQAAHASTRGMSIANSIGTALTEYNKEAGIQTVGFTQRKTYQAASFSNQNNDAAKTKGTVVYRKSSRGDDYYGVLRGASGNGTQGIIVEHAFHATQIVRKLANASPDLYENWAKCDAYGIANGFGFIN